MSLLGISEGNVGDSTSMSYDRSFLSRTRPKERAQVGSDENSVIVLSSQGFKDAIKMKDHR